MLIKVDESGHVAIKQLCDIALKSGGISTLQGVIAVLQSVVVEKPEDKNVEL